MAFYSDVRRGENFKPSALMFNDIARSLNKIDGFRAAEISKVDDGATRISVCNETAVTLNARSAVQLYPVKSGINISRPDLLPPYGVSVYDSKSAWDWCILEETLKPGEIGSAILFGVTEVVLSISNSDTNKIPANGFVIPNSDDSDVFDIVSYPTQAKLLRVHKGENGNFVAEIAFIPFKTGGASDEYNGFFKIVHKGGTTFEIIDGSGYRPNFCGTTDIPDCVDVPVTSLTFPSNIDDTNTMVYLNVYYDEENGYSIKFEFEPKKYNPGIYKEIGAIWKDGRVRQDYKEGGGIIFSREWFL